MKDITIEQFLSELASHEFKQLKRQEQVIRERIVNFSASDRLPRGQLHERDA